MTDALPPAEWGFSPGTIMPDPSIFSLGDRNGTLVKIDLKTGHVTLAPGMTPDEGAKAFWKAVDEMSGRRKCAP